MNVITTCNTKLGGNIAQVNMPVGSTCRPDAPCFKECYCRKGNMMFFNVRLSHMTKLKMYMENSQNFFNMIDIDLSTKPFEYFRWHSSGDIVDEQYLRLMCWLANRHKETQFLCFTKKYELVNEYLNHHRKPKNLVICLSNWGKWHPENPHNLPMSYVDFGKGEDDIPKSAYECGGLCSKCKGTHCFNMKKGDSVVFYKH